MAMPDIGELAPIHSVWQPNVGNKQIYPRV